MKDRFRDRIQAGELGVPGQHEWAMGAIASGGIRVLNQTLIYEC